jgi:hypothetical protein
MGLLLSIENHHTQTGPDVPEGGYLGYFQNQHGEQLIFHQAKGAPEGSLWHGDMEFERHAVRRGETDLIMNTGERVWLVSCWAESRLLRNEELDETARAVADAIFELLMMDKRAGTRFAERLAEGMEKAKGGQTPSLVNALRAQSDRFDAAAPKT